MTTESNKSRIKHLGIIDPLLVEGATDTIEQLYAHFQKLDQLKPLASEYSHLIQNFQMGEVSVGTVIFNVMARTMHVMVNDGASSMPLVTWAVDVSNVERTLVGQDNIRRRKVWSRYVTLNNVIRWEISYSDHPRDPLRLRSGMVAANGVDFIREVQASIRANPYLGDTTRLLKAIGCWEVSKHFTSAQIELLQIWRVRLTSLHVTRTIDQVLDTLRLVGELTQPTAVRTLEQNFQFFDLS